VPGVWAKSTVVIMKSRQPPFQPPLQPPLSDTEVAAIASSGPELRQFSQRPWSYCTCGLAIMGSLSLLGYGTIQEVRRLPQPAWTNDYFLLLLLTVVLISTHRIRRRGLIPPVPMRWRLLDAAFLLLMFWAAFYLFTLLALVLSLDAVFRPDPSEALGDPQTRQSLLLKLLGLPVLALIASRCRRWTLRAVRRHSGHCERCGYNLSGNTSGTCPECGTPTGVSVTTP
jgi:hypothetical protein